MKVSGICLFIVVLSGFLAPRCGATVYQSNGSEANIQSIHDNQARDGDTIVVPAGIFSWTQKVNITKGITLQGQTTISGAGTSNPIINDGTIILDNTPRSGNGGIIKVTNSPSQSFRLSRVTFRAGGITTYASGAAVTLSSTGASPTYMRVDNCHFDQLYDSKMIWVSGWVYGVADHNVMHLRGNTFGFTVMHPNYGGSSQINGNGSWADYPWYGTNKFWFAEDNTIIRLQQTTNAVIDSDAGGRYVFRHNYMQNCVPQNHGTEGGTQRSARANEFYDNTFNVTVPWNGGGSRGGTQLWHDNTFIGREPTVSRLCALANYRTTWIRPNTIWGVSDGTSVWDRNDTEGNGTYVEGHPPFLFQSGTATSANVVNGNQSTFTDSRKNWTPNQWTGYSIRNPNPAIDLGAFIISNTATTITYWWGTPASPTFLTFSVGDPYQIHRVLTVMDGCGMGKADLIAGVPQPVNTVTGGAFWTHQATEPCYSWNNVYSPNGHILNFAGGGGAPNNLPPRPGIEYFNLGGGFATDTTPSQVRSRYVAALNGVDYTGTFVYPHPLVTTQPLVAPTSTQCSLLQRRLDRLKRRQQRLERRHRSNPRLKRRIRRVQRQLELQHCL